MFSGDLQGYFILGIIYLRHQEIVCLEEIHGLSVKETKLLTTDGIGRS